MTYNSIKKEFVNYFLKRGHVEKSSSPVIPFKDPSVMFVNAGMNQFKDIFLGNEQSDECRVVSVQKCIRAGGKHNDLENVGHTSRHLTFFEMLGNFSFGDYFKDFAIKYAWEVSNEIFRFPEEKIWITVHKDDEEAYELWSKYIKKERITKLGNIDNFWSMGPVGPCGPSSELFFDRGSDFSSARNPAEDTLGERFLEFWNLVFMQYNQVDENTRKDIPKKCIDTGAGLERIMAIKEGVYNVFDTDIFQLLIKEIENLSGKKCMGAPPFHVIADHIRTLSFAIADGAMPSNEERGYVLRKILRRATMYGKKIGIVEPFLHKLVYPLSQIMGDDFPEIRLRKNIIENTILVEEESFMTTLNRGEKFLNDIVAKAQLNNSKTISGEEAFKLKDTYGFPIQEMEMIAKDHGLTVDKEQYLQCEEMAKNISKNARQNVTQNVNEDSFYASLMKKLGKTIHSVSSKLLERESCIIAIVKDKGEEKIFQDDKATIILKESIFFAEKGGQVGDRGIISTTGGEFAIESCYEEFPGIIVHRGIVTRGTLAVGDKISCIVDKRHRKMISQHHTATHILQWALRKICGPEVKQCGSKVESERLRFDFAYHKELSQEQIADIEGLVNEVIDSDERVIITTKRYQEIRDDKSILQFFGDKYDDVVTLVEVGESKELCGGMHSESSGELGMFLITSKGSISAGTRRLEACVGNAARKLSSKNKCILKSISQKLKTDDNDVEKKIDEMLKNSHDNALEIKQYKKFQNILTARQCIERAEKLSGESLLIIMEITSSANIKEVAMEIIKKASAIVLLLSQSDCKSTVVVCVDDSNSKKLLNARAIIAKVNEITGNKGGGSATFAQSGGSKVSNTIQFFTSMRKWIITKYYH